MVGLRFTAAAQAAGVDSRVTAHSGRVELASELTSRGAWTTGRQFRGRSWASAADYLSPWLSACGKPFRVGRGPGVRHGRHARGERTAWRFRFEHYSEPAHRGPNGEESGALDRTSGCGSSCSNKFTAAPRRTGGRPNDARQSSGALATVPRPGDPNVAVSRVMKARVPKSISFRLCTPAVAEPRRRHCCERSSSTIIEVMEAYATLLYVVGCFGAIGAIGAMGLSGPWGCRLISALGCSSNPAERSTHEVGPLTAAHPGALRGPGAPRRR